MAKKRRMPIALQRQKLEDHFCKCNIEDCGTADIDWKHETDKTLSYSENLENLASIHPQYSWEKPQKITARTYEKQFIADLKDQASQYSYDVLKGSRIKKLERRGRKLDKVTVELAECKKVGPPPRKAILGRCRVKTVPVVHHFRCKPRK